MVTNPVTLVDLEVDLEVNFDDGKIRHARNGAKHIEKKDTI